MNSILHNALFQRGLSRILGKLAGLRLGYVTQWAIKAFIAHYHVNMAEAKITDIAAFNTFNAFFTRELKSDARVLSHEANAVISPVDGCVSEVGLIDRDRLLQAKGSYFSVSDLVGIRDLFHNGAFLTIYLAPKDYHRFHLPIAGKLLQMIYIPGTLHSVNPTAVKNIPGLFAQNERVVCIFETAVGKMAFIAVGAMIVGSIAMTWHGIVAPQKNKSTTTWEYQDQSIEFKRGDEIGHFQLGSTVIILFEKDAVSWNAALQAATTLRLGEVVGTIATR